MLNNKSNTICIIPARQNSIRVKNKNLLKINGKTLTEITIDIAKKSNLFKEIILSSDSEKILKIGKKKKILSLKREKKLSGSNIPTDIVIKNLIEKIQIKFENIILLQVTSPLRKISTLRKFNKYCINNKLKSCLTVTDFNENFSKKGKYFNPINKNIRKSQKRPIYIYENGLIYFFKKDFFLKRSKIYPKKNWEYYVTNKYESLDINEYDDYLISKFLK